MMERTLRETVAELVNDVVEHAGCELVDVEYVTENKRKVLRLLIDKQDGVTIDDCSDVSRAVEPLLDAADPISGPYDLEVSSPGTDRPISSDSDLRRNAGRLIEVTLKQPAGPVIRYEGILSDHDDETLTVILDEPFIKGVRPKTNGKTVVIDRGSVKTVKRAIRF